MALKIMTVLGLLLIKIALMFFFFESLACYFNFYFSGGHSSKETLWGF